MIELIQQQVASYNAANAIEEALATKEALQEVALYALWRAGFFDVAAFQGGTSLRILHKLPRFSEDLDFILKAPNPAFEWGPYLPEVHTCLEEFGLKSEVLDRSRMDQNVREAVLKDDSIANQLNFQFFRGAADRELQIKFEIDVNPPSGSGFEYSYLGFPLDFEICQQDLPSNFALKIHALLCRRYLKGRDWYDFNWYVRRLISPNLAHLKAALRQQGPWAGQEVAVTTEWMIEALNAKAHAIDWKLAAQDVERFLSPAERRSLELWSERFFLTRISMLRAF